LCSEAGGEWRAGGRGDEPGTADRRSRAPPLGEATPGLEEVGEPRDDAADGDPRGSDVSSGMGDAAEGGDPAEGDATAKGGAAESGGDATANGGAAESGGDATANGGAAESGGDAGKGDAEENGGDPGKGDAPESGTVGSSGSGSPAGGGPPATWSAAERLGRRRATRWAARLKVRRVALS